MGKDEDDNVEVRRWKTPAPSTSEPAHWDIAEDLDILDFERGQKFPVAVSSTIKAWGEPA